MIPFIDLAAQQARIKPQLDAAIQRVLSHGKYILGPEVDELEERLAAYTGAKYCITCANGTDALQIALMALGIGAGDEVITPAFNYIAAAEAATVIGAQPIYVDIDRETFNMDARLLEGAITQRTKAIIPVSMFGQCADMDAINSISKKYAIPVIEDAAQSFGATYGDKKSCNLSTIATTSFFPAKPMGCYGDGGAIFTSDGELAKTLRMVARHGQERRYHHQILGMNSRLDTIQAAVLLQKLTIFDEEVTERQNIAKRYKSLYEELSPSGADRVLSMPGVAVGQTSAWAQFTLRVTHRDKVREIMLKKGVPTNVYYPIPLSRQTAVAHAASLVEESEKAASEVLSLPMYPYLLEHCQRTIISALICSLKGPDD